ncbi:MAG: tRNA pseudouridine(54/55) synthase Pus10 [Candidatus Hodarchaeota archaeon]
MESIILKKVDALTRDLHCCNSCLGRQFGNLLSGLSNEKRGIALKTLLLMEWENKHRISALDRPKVSSLLSKDFQTGYLSIQRFFPEIQPVNTSCDICKDILSTQSIDKLAHDAFNAVRDYEFSTFLVGSQFSPSILDKEDTIRSTYNLEFGESIKSEFNREIGKRIQDLISFASVDFKAPNIVITFDLIHDKIRIKSNPLFILGRYRKLKRGIPQSKWFCRECRGKGCDYCNNTGKMYQESVEEFISDPLLSAAKGVASKFHGSGREDIDARMLGAGRPFVLEISEPKKRNLDFEILSEKINANAASKVEIDIDGITTRTKVRELKTKSSRNAKGYRAVVSLEAPLMIEKSELNDIAKKLSNIVIQQRTPLRVAHRRADKVRARKVISFQIEEIEPQALTVYIVCEGGLYVKELISGDEGRTYPSLSNYLNIPAVVSHLDVIEIFDSNLIL